jgi:hypothetical protein
MSAQHRDNPVTREIVWRVYQLPEDLRTATRQRRQALGQTLREYLAYAIETELPGLLAALREHLPAAAGIARPARLPLTGQLLEALRSAGAESGLPAARLLLACLGRAARRKRRRRWPGGPRENSAAPPPTPANAAGSAVDAPTAAGEEE